MPRELARRLAQWMLAGTLALLPFASALAQQAAPQQIVLGEKHLLQSKVLGEERSYWVFLPLSYRGEQSKSYPVLYLLDGTAHFHAVTGIVHHLSSSSSAVKRIPELIVVAIPNTRRSRDFTPTAMKAGPYSEGSGGADNFLRFLREELFVEIESRYRALPERTLVGHSLGGLFALHALERRPDLFANYIALDPSLWWDGEVLTRRLAPFDASVVKRPTTVYIARARLLPQRDAEMRRHSEAVKRFGAALQDKSSPLLRLRLQDFEDENHLSVPLIGVYNGLLFAFEGYPAS